MTLTNHSQHDKMCDEVCMTISTRVGTLDLAKHIDAQYIDTVLAFGSWCVITGKRHGYIVHTCNAAKKTRWLHRVVYELANGPIPEGYQIDHINGDKTNNFLSNLRLVTNQQNSFNTKAKGYSWNKQHQKWQSRIFVNGKSIYLGRYNTESEARQAYLDAKTIYHNIEENKL